MSSEASQVLARLGQVNDQDDLNRLKISLAKKLKAPKILSNIELAAHSEKGLLESRKELLTIKPMRTMSGVAVIAIMTQPISCRHGRCTYCPGGVNSHFGTVTQSYTGNEPASMRAVRNNYDPYLQVMNRLEQYAAMNKQFGKVEMIIMGGTFTSFPLRYQEEFIKYAFKAMNDFSAMFMKSSEVQLGQFREFFELPGTIKDSERVARIQRRLLSIKGESSLDEELNRNETAAVRCVALCFETRPDWCYEPQISQILKLGCTRVELGLQSIYNEVLEKVGRMHDVGSTIHATQLLRDSFIKVGYHVMPGLPGSTKEMDISMMRELFSNPDFRPDALKIYPCLVVKGTKLYEEWEQGEYAPLTTETAAEIIAEGKRFIPEYCRVMRIQRDIPTQVITAGVLNSNLRQYVMKQLKEKGLNCKCIRCREPRGRRISLDAITVKKQEYQAAGGTELFISAEDQKNDILIGFCRLRIPAKPFRPEITGGNCGIRELHVYGDLAPIGGKGEVQHRGIGKMLLAEAERSAWETFDAKKMLVISGVGAREYYRKHGYAREGAYMAKVLKV